MDAVLLREVGRRPEVVGGLVVDEPRAGEALVAIEAAGVCGSDLAILDGKMPYPMPTVLGHEAAGRVVALGERTDGPAPGTRVVLWMRPPCRACAMCRRDLGHLCQRSGAMSANGTLPDGRTAVADSDGGVAYRAFGIGAFAREVVMPVGGLVPVPDAIPTEVAALLSCGVATGAGAVLQVARPHAGDVVVVFGAGGVGAAAALAAQAVGARVAVVDPSAERRDAALAAGVQHALEGGPKDALRAQVRAAFDGDPVDVALDCAGIPAVLQGAWALVRQGGTVVAVGLQPAGEQITLPAPVVPLSHRRLLGCFMGGIDPQRDLPGLFDLVASGRLPVERTITARRPLGEAPAAMEDLRAASGLRTVLDCTA